MTASLPITALDYPLTENLIAVEPVQPRDSARMMVVHRESGAVDHRTVRDLPEYLARGDRIVVNDTAVAPARLVGRRIDSGGRVEGLFLRSVTTADVVGGAGSTFVALLRSNGRLRAGTRLEFDGRNGVAMVELMKRDGAAWIVRSSDGSATRLLDAVGHTPLPPYILRARRERSVEVDDAVDREWYQTVFADAVHRDSVAAPTAGLHFTPELLARIEAQGIERFRVTLDVGPGTFKPIETDTLEAHPMHREQFVVPAATIRALRETGRGRTVVIGTTTVRALESLPEPLPLEGDWRGDTDLLIGPSSQLRFVDALLTNFHLPRSTLLALVSALVGLDRLHELYRIAVDRRYRFYSYGDAMLIL